MVSRESLYRFLEWGSLKLGVCSSGRGRVTNRVDSTGISGICVLRNM